jgi:hypothetical protein
MTSNVRFITIHDHRHGSPCNRCGVEFKIGDKIVTMGVTHGRVHTVNRRKTRRYHIKCYVDAHGEPIYD